MRIAYVYDALYPYVTGGAERRYYELGRRLAERGHAVEFVSWHYAPGAAGGVHDGMTLHAAGPAPALHDRDGRRTFREALAFALRCVPILTRLDADVIDCSSIPYLPAFAAAALRRRGTRLIVTWHEYMGARWGAYLPHGAAIAERVERATAAVGDERVAVSSFTARRLPRGPKTSVVENGIDMAAIQRTPGEILRRDQNDSASVRSATVLADAPQLVVAGRLVPHKRVGLLLDVLARLPGVTAAVVGDGPERPKLEQRASDLGIADRVRFTGQLPRADDVYAYFRSAKAMLVLSEQEGFGMTVIEAQAAGAVPIVVRSEFSAAADLVVDGVTGILVAARPDDIAASVRSLLADGVLRESLRRNAVAAAERYDWDAIADRMERVYTGAPVTALEHAAMEHAA
jgi:glycosyltransferase involved in cell wall biosynthesis